MGRPYSPFTAPDARRFVPRDFSADTVLLKTEELGKKALTQSAIFRQIHERLLPLHRQQPQLVDGRALAYCGALLVSVAKAEAESQRLTSRFWRRLLRSVASCPLECSRRSLRIISVFSVC